jgi:uncharacterized lipoprotein YajG
MRSSTVVTRKIFLLLAIFFLSGCKSEQNYRGVPSPAWEHLTVEQKQLIVDRAYQDELNKDEIK